MKMKKRGFEMQFHWIFILIAGAIIITFFFSVIQKQRNLSQEKLSITLSANMEAIFTGAIESKGTVQTLTMPRTGMAFSCSEGCDCNFYMGRKATSFKEKIIFAPDILEEGDLLVWTLDWKVPFRISNFFFITNPEVKYFFIHDPSNQDSVKMFNIINENLPDNVESSFMKLGDVGLISPTHRKTRLIFVQVDPAFVLETIKSSFRKSDVSVLYILDDFSLRFYQRQDDSFVAQDSFYLELPALFGAIFAEEKTLYECNIRKAFRKMNHISKVYSLRATELEKSDPDCIYSTNNLDSLNDLSRQIAQSAITNIISGDLLGKINRLEEDLENQNRNIILQSCPEIY